MKNKKHIYTFINTVTGIIIFILYSCNAPNNNNIEKILKKWQYKEVKFPHDMIYTQYGRDTIIYSPPINKYKIVSYINYAECIPCRLDLPFWKELMDDFNQNQDTTVVFYFIFRPESKKELTYFLEKEEFNYPIIVDDYDLFNKANNLPENDILHTFLLDKNNRIIAIGNPTHNPKVKELYFKIIQGENLSENTYNISK